MLRALQRLKASMYVALQVYRLNLDGLWDDKGTGHVSVEFMEVCPSPTCLHAAQAPHALLAPPVLGSLMLIQTALGMIACFSAQQSGSLGLVVISESDSRTLLIHRICREDIYQRQGGA